jgi:hypothetical protein
MFFLAACGSDGTSAAPASPTTDSPSGPPRVLPAGASDVRLVSDREGGYNLTLFVGGVDYRLDVSLLPLGLALSDTLKDPILVDMDGTSAYQASCDLTVVPVAGGTTGTASQQGDNKVTWELDGYAVALSGPASPSCGEGSAGASAVQSIALSVKPVTGAEWGSTVLTQG